MFKEYIKYQSEDFLTDDYFVDSMLNPTPENEKYWKVLIDSEKLNVNEFISAYMTLKNLHNAKPEVPEDKINALWERIETKNEFNNRKVKYFKRLRYTAVACSITAIVGMSMFGLFKNNEVGKIQNIADFAEDNIIHTKQLNGKIELISNEQTLSIVGTHASVEYDESGKVKVNKETIENIQSKNSTNNEPVYNQLRVPYGKRAYLTLSDGTSLWVNTGTTVIYPSKFAKDRREIYVSGEVFAEVFHDASRPFIIKTEKLDVQVLGTVFNVTAYNDDKETNVVLVSGSVNVKPKNGKATIIKPNQLFAYTEQASTLKTVDVENYTSWHEGNYIFKNEPIESVLLRLSRYYNVTMKLPSSASGISCSGKLELKDDLTQLMNGLTQISNMSFTVKDNEYKVKFE